MAEHYGGSRRNFQSYSAAADLDAPVVAHAGFVLVAPYVGPPGIRLGRAQDRATFFERQIPCGLGCHGQLAVDFMRVAMTSQVVDGRVGSVKVSHVLGSKVGWQPSLPILVFPLDLSFGLGRGSIFKGNSVVLQGLPQLGQGIWFCGRKKL